MQDYKHFKRVLNETQIIRMPKKTIGTFIDTDYRYYFLSKYENDKNKTTVREGNFLIAKPLVLLPEQYNSLFQGFRRDVGEMGEKILGGHVLMMRSLGYCFKQTPREKWVENNNLSTSILNISRIVQDSTSDVILLGDDQYWEISLLKFVFKMIERSFRLNIGEIEERGFYDKRGVPPKVRREIETLFISARTNKKLVNQLGKILLEHNLFEEYEEEFFKFFKS